MRYVSMLLAPNHSFSGLAGRAVLLLCDKETETLIELMRFRDRFVKLNAGVRHDASDVHLSVRILDQVVTAYGLAGEHYVQMVEVSFVRGTSPKALSLEVYEGRRDIHMLGSTTECKQNQRLCGPALLCM